VSFASGPALDDAARATLDGFAAKAGADSALVIRGSTDSRGADTRNRAVSLRRARLVADYLASKGIAKDRMTVIGLGEDRPVAPNAHLDGSDDPEGRARNRRVEIEVTPAAPEADAADANASESSSPE
jgi:OOP family OmpA-OmpF porin